MSFNRNNFTGLYEEVIVRNIKIKEFQSRRVWSNELRKFVEDENAPIQIWKLITGYTFVAGGTLNIQIETKKNKTYNFKEVDKLIFVNAVCEYRVRKQEKIDAIQGTKVVRQFNTLHILNWEKVISDEDIEGSPTIEAEQVIETKSGSTIDYSKEKLVSKEPNWFEEIEE